MQSELTLSVGGLPPLSARGCVQSLQPIPQGEFVRTLNGDLIFVGQTKHKYRSTVKCADENVLATGGLAVGTGVTVGCIQKLCQKVPANSSRETISLERPPVPESVSVVDDTKREFTSFQVEGQNVTFTPHEQDLFLFYAPLLHMRVLSFTLTTDEWKLKSTWSVDLEEI